VSKLDKSQRSSGAVCTSRGALLAECKWTAEVQGDAFLTAWQGAACTSCTSQRMGLRPETSPLHRQCCRSAVRCLWTV